MTQSSITQRRREDDKIASVIVMEHGAGGSASSPRSTSPSSSYSKGIWQLRKAMFYWDLGHYGSEFIYWLSTFMAFFLSALWEESFKIRAAAEEGVGDAARRLMEVAGTSVHEMLRRRLASKASEYEYENSEEFGEGGVEEVGGQSEGSVPEDEFAPGELNTYAAFMVGATFTLLIKYVVFPWIFMSLVPRLKSMTSDSFALSMFCVFKAFGKLVKLCTEFALPMWMEKSGEEVPDDLKPSAITSIGEYFGDFVFAPWLFAIYVMPELKALLTHTQFKKDSEP